MQGDGIWEKALNSLSDKSLKVKLITTVIAHKRDVLVRAICLFLFLFSFLEITVTQALQVAVIVAVEEKKDLCLRKGHTVVGFPACYESTEGILDQPHWECCGCHVTSSVGCERVQSKGQALTALGARRASQHGKRRNYYIFISFLRKQLVIHYFFIQSKPTPISQNYLYRRHLLTTNEDLSNILLHSLLLILPYISLLQALYKIKLVITTLMNDLDQILYGKGYSISQIDTVRRINRVQLDRQNPYYIARIIRLEVVACGITYKETQLLLIHATS